MGGVDADDFHKNGEFFLDDVVSPGPVERAFQRLGAARNICQLQFSESIPVPNSQTFGASTQFRLNAVGADLSPEIGITGFCLVAAFAFAVFVGVARPRVVAFDWATTTAINVAFVTVFGCVVTMGRARALPDLAGVGDAILAGVAALTQFTR